MLQANFLSLRKNNTEIKASGSINDRHIYLTSFLVPLVIVLVILISAGVYPFGDECFLRTDMYHQYAPFMSEFREKLQSGSSLLYSFDIGLGVNFTALYAYYLASPLNWLIIFVSRDLVIEFIMLMVVLKIGLCGAAMAYYLRSHTSRPDMGICFFSIFYALSGYICAYYWNIMWLDCIVLFPLLILGMERLFEEGRGGLYTVSLGVSILSNYYISIMSCMFLCVYFIALCLLRRPSLRETLIKALGFVWFSLLSGGMAAVLLFPEIAAMSYTASSEINFPEIFSEYFSLFDMLVRHLPGIETEQALDHWPNIYCGAGVLLLFPLYLMNRRIGLREKTVYTLLLLFMLMGFSINVLNFIWHGLHYPNSLPARQSYIYVFLLLFMCFRLYTKRRFVRLRELSLALLFAVLFILLCQHTIGYGEQHINFAVYYCSLLLILLYSGIFYAYIRRSFRRQALGFLTLCLIMAEASANTALTGITTTSRVSYTKNNEDIRALVDGLFPSSELFRIERDNSKTKNDGAWLNFPSASLFSSVANADCTAFFRKLGCEASTNAYSTTGSTPFVDMLLGIRYVIYESPKNEGEGRTFIESRGEAYLYENNYTLPVGFLLPRDMASDWMLELTDPVLIQNSFCDLLRTPQILVPNGEPGNAEGTEQAVTLTSDGEYYAVIKNPEVRDVTVTWPEKKKTFNNVDRGYLIELGECHRGDTIYISSETSGQQPEAEIYRVDYAALKKVHEKLSEGAFSVTGWEDGHIEGEIDVKKAMTYGSGDTAELFFSIPYDEGWEVRIDGVRADTKKVYDTFLSVSVPLGSHVIELDYMPKGLMEGAAVSIISILLFAGTLVLDKRRRRVLLPKEEEYEGT